ncbi:MAG: SDR family oxidoreductase [Rhodospirillaceae bacterium]|nr:SDR family oxidoreductase [Rhodospirillaceae bacterium]
MTKTVLITGASSGYGKATAELFLKRGWNVVATMRQPKPEAFAQHDKRLKLLPLDVTNSASIEAAIAEAVTVFGRIDALVNNAGIGLLSAFEATPETTQREIFETNTFGVMAVCRAIIPTMRQQGGGTIINVTSSAAIAPMPMVAIYTASKCAVEGFSESLSHEMRLVGIKVKLVEPGLAPTTSFAANGVARMNGLTPAPYDAFTQAYFAKMQNYPTAYSTEGEIAEAVLTAATDTDDRLRYPAGPDTKLVAALRWTTSEDKYVAGIRQMFVPQT